MDLKGTRYAGDFAGQTAESDLGAHASSSDEGPSWGLEGDAVESDLGADAAEAEATAEAAAEAAEKEQGPSWGLEADEAEGDIGEEAEETETSRNGLAWDTTPEEADYESVGVEESPPPPPPPGAGAYSSSPIGQPGYPGGKGPGEVYNLPASYRQVIPLGHDVPGLFTEEPSQGAPEPYSYWKDWFTLPAGKGAGFNDWKEMGQCMMPGKKPVEGGGIPRLAVLPKYKGSTTYDLHMYFYADSKLKHFVANIGTNDLTWTEGKVVGLDNVINIPRSKYPPNLPSFSGPLYFPGDMAVIYNWPNNWTGSLTNLNPVLRFYFMPESQFGQFRSPLYCATTTDGTTFKLSNVTFPAQAGDDGWVTVPHAIRMNNGEWWMYYVGNIPEWDYQGLLTPDQPKPTMRPHSTRLQFSTDNGVNWKSMPITSFYNPKDGLMNTRVDPDVVYLDNTDPKGAQYRMYVKGMHNFEVTESVDGFQWSSPQPLDIGHDTKLPGEKKIWNLDPVTGEPSNYTRCFDPTVVRIPSNNPSTVQAYMFFVKEAGKGKPNEIHYAKLIP